MTAAYSDDIAAIAGLEVVPKILDVVCRTTGLGFAAVARVTADRWIACAVRNDIGFGLRPGGELKVETTICSEIRDSGKAVIIDHVAEDPLFRDHHTPKQYGLQSYISTPIYRGGAFFGTLCAIDPRPARLKTQEIIATFELFAQLIGNHLDAHDRLARTEAALMTERDTAELREQFIAVLGHDLRSPLAAIEGGTVLLRRALTPQKTATVLNEMQRSLARVFGMIDNVLDFARGRLGAGLDVTPRTDANLAAVLEQVVSEFRTAQPARKIDADIALTAPVAADDRRLAQLASNLIANALAHGDAAVPVRVSAHTVSDAFELSVSNAGTPIDPAMVERLFQPFTRASVRPGQQGLGLGLYIASEIARAHGGTLTVTSDETETRFTFRMPLCA